MGATAALLGAVRADEHGDVAQAYGLGGFPFAWVVLGLFVIVLLRAQGTYWLGRGIAAGTIRSGLAARLGRRLSGPSMDRALGYLRRYGAVAVTLSFFTVGIQTMINAGAGIIRMSWPRYTLFMVPGCVAWAFIYATVGLTAFYAGVAAAAGSPWAIALIVAAAAGAVVLLARRRSGRDAQVTRSS